MISLQAFDATVELMAYPPGVTDFISDVAVDDVTFSWG
jgi:hypothetical protein